MVPCPDWYVDVLAADRAHVPLWDFKAQPTVWREIYRTVVISERQASNELAKREARRANRRGRGGR